MTTYTDTERLDWMIANSVAILNQPGKYFIKSLLVTGDPRQAIDAHMPPKVEPELTGWFDVKYEKTNGYVSSGDPMLYNEMQHAKCWARMAWEALNAKVQDYGDRCVAAAVPRWVPVGEGLPKRIVGTNVSDEVLVLTDDGSIKLWRVSYEHQHKGFDYGCEKTPAFDNAGNVTHWLHKMALVAPTPPKEGV